MFVDAGWVWDSGEIVEFGDFAFSLIFVKDGQAQAVSVLAWGADEVRIVAGQG